MKNIFFKILVFGMYFIGIGLILITFYTLLTTHSKFSSAFGLPELVMTVLILIPAVLLIFFARRIAKRRALKSALNK
jgi:hypothetical protein